MLSHISSNLNIPQGYIIGKLIRGADIQALYLARDATNLYLRLDLWENANPNLGNAPDPYRGRYSFRLINNGPYPDLFLSVAGGFLQWSLGFNGSNRSCVPALFDDKPNLVGVNVKVIEVQRIKENLNL